MHIENADTLRTWLTNTLSPICDADPAALAKYVMALLKKDKAENELKEFCIDQLDVFLQKETKGFVDQLFEVIRDKSYLNPTINSAPKPSALVNSDIQESPLLISAPNLLSLTSELASECTDATTEDRGAVTDTSPVLLHGSTGSYHRHRGGVRDSHRLIKRAAVSPVHSSPPRKSGRKFSRSRSRSRDHTTVKNQSSAASAVKENDRRGTVPAAKSSAARGVSGDRDKENNESSRRRHGHSPSSSRRRRSRSRSDKERQKSPEKSDKTSSGIDVYRTEALDKSPQSDKDKKRKKIRCRDYDEKGYCMRGDSCIYDHGPDPVVVEEVALPRIITMKAPPPPVDFSQPPPGYVVHPPPPGVDHSTFSTSTTTMTTGGGCSSTTATEAYNPEAPSISASIPSVGSHSGASSLAYGQSVVPPAPVWNQPVPAPYSVTYTAAGNAIERTSFATGSGGSSYHPRGGGRGGYQHRQPVPYDKTNKTLEVRRIPVAMNTIAKLNEHFSQFGPVTNIQVHFRGDPEAALIQFAARHSAISAYKSTAPILNNRFIRMYWHNKESGICAVTTDSEQLESEKQPLSIKDRLGPAPVDPTVPIDDTSFRPRRVGNFQDASDGNFKAVLLSSTGNLTKTLYNPTALKSAAMAVQRRASEAASEQPFATDFGGDGQKGRTVINTIDNATAQAKRLRSDKHLEFHRRQLELQKAKMDLFNRQLEQQKLLINQLETCKNAAKKKEIATCLKEMQADMDKLRKELGEITVKPLPSVAVEAKKEIERHLLDAELEVINQRQQGSDTTDLQQRLNELRHEVMLLNELTASSGKDGNADPKSAAQSEVHNVAPNAIVQRPIASTARFPPRKHRHIPAFATLDKRPREMTVTGFEEKEKDQLIEHFQSFGLLEDFEFLQQKGDNIKQRKALVTFKTRREAELTMANGKEFNGHALDIQWFNRRTHKLSDKEETSSEMTAQDLLATLDDDDPSSDESKNGEEEDVPEIERGLFHYGVMTINLLKHKDELLAAYNAVLNSEDLDDW
uniref:RNA-binding protein 26 n=1 Tax=Romanomermis culicivorax TaxID=13658 RepID=A0A915J679_ROMCU